MTRPEDKRSTNMPTKAMNERTSVDPMVPKLGCLTGSHSVLLMVTNFVR